MSITFVSCLVATYLVVCVSIVVTWLVILGWLGLDDSSNVFVTSLVVDVFDSSNVCIVFVYILVVILAIVESIMLVVNDSSNVVYLVVLVRLV